MCELNKEKELYMLVKDLMTKDVFTLREDGKIFSASEAMTFRNIRHIPIVDKENKLVGIVTSRDLLNSLARELMPLQVKDIMTRATITVTPDVTVHMATEIMLGNKFGCLPVIDKSNKLVGIITETDLLKELFKLTRTTSSQSKEKARC